MQGEAAGRAEVEADRAVAAAQIAPRGAAAMLRAEEISRLKSARVWQLRSLVGTAAAGAAEPRSTTTAVTNAAVERTRRPYTLTRARGEKLTPRVQFTAPAEHYDRFMGRYVPQLAVALADAAGVAAGLRALDVGCGPGGLTRELAARLGADHVAAIDPAKSSPRRAAAQPGRRRARGRRGGAAVRGRRVRRRRCARSCSRSCATPRRARARWRASRGRAAS